MEKINAFNKRAEEYDRWFDDHRTWFLGEVAALKMAVPSTGTGLEVGVGSGRFAGELGIATGVEPAENMAAIAAQRGIRVMAGIAEELPFEAASFDFLLMVTVDCFLQNAAKAFAEAYRVLRPSGTIIIGMIDKASPLGQKYQELKNHDPFYRHAQFHEPGEITGELEMAGFCGFSYWQTLRNAAEDPVEEPSTGYGEGGFVVIRAQKNDKPCRQN